MSNRIHPTAIIDPRADLDEDVEVGPHAIIEEGVSIGARTRIGPFVHIQGQTEIGADNTIYTGATIGLPPQFIGFKGEATRTVIGTGNTIREYANINRALTMEGATIIGNNCFIMGFSHIAHDCILGNQVTLANGALLAGHVIVGDRAFISGNCGVHQFVRIGRLVMLGGMTRLTQDAPPFTIVVGDKAEVYGINTVGLRRAGLSSEVRNELRQLVHKVYRRDMTRSEALAAIEVDALHDEGREFVDFIKTSKRGVVPLSTGGKLADGESE